MAVTKGEIEAHCCGCEAYLGKKCRIFSKSVQVSRTENNVACETQAKPRTESKDKPTRPTAGRVFDE